MFQKWNKAHHSELRPSGLLRYRLHFPCQPVCLLPTVSGEKKEDWSWESYLEEQKAITAPVSLFQDVSGTISA